MSAYAPLGLAEFLHNFPGMSVCPIHGSDLRVEGTFCFTAESGNYGRITDTFNLRISFPTLFPRAVPVVNELGGRIPIDAEFHVNVRDQSLCLGSPLRLLSTIAIEPTLDGFSKRCLIPYLYAVSRKLQYGGKFLFGELDHGRPGHLADYVDLFGVQNEFQAMSAIQFLGMRKRIANKLLCPCGCVRRLGLCTFNHRLRKFRLLAARSWYRKLSFELSSI
jgi:hypothetical protein